MSRYNDSEERTSSRSSGGIGFLGALGILFIGLKLAGIIDWSWWWVTAPLWGGLAFGLIILIAIAAMAIAVNRRR